MCWQHGRYHGLGMDALANGRVGSMEGYHGLGTAHWPMDGWQHEHDTMQT